MNQTRSPVRKPSGSSGSRHAAFLPRPDSHKPKGAKIRPSRMSKRRAIVLVLVHIVAFVHIAHWKVTGSSLTPVEPSEAMQTLELGYVNAGFVLFVLLILATMVLGRFFCGWACHVVAYQDLAAWILRKIGIKPKPVRSRLLVLVPLGAAFYMFIWPTLWRFLQGGANPTFVAHLTTDSFWATFPGPIVAALTFLVDGFLIVYFLGSKGFCTYGCPYGAIFYNADKLAAGRIKVTDACEQCGHCTATCTSNVRVHEEVARYGKVVDPGCMKCMDCVSVCPKNALHFGWELPWKRGIPSGAAAQRAAAAGVATAGVATAGVAGHAGGGTASHESPSFAARSAALAKAAKAKKKPRRVYDFSWPEEITMALVFFAALYAFRGLYGMVPFLFAIGLSVIAAFLTILGWRLLRRSQMQFQHHPLRQGRHLTPAGIAFAVLVPTFLLFTIHSAWVQYHTREGERLLIAAEQTERESRASLVQASLDHLLKADRSALVSVGSVHLQIGSILREMGRFEEAEERMRKAIDTNPEMIAPRLSLAELLIRRQAYPEAEGVLLAVLEHKPDDATAQRWLEGVRARMP